jgi:putative YphP/YqiW family bacilliredoxin
MDESLYDRSAVQPMIDELNTVGVRSLTTADEVNDALTARQGTVLVVVNSVCGCAAGNARPGVTRALQHKTIPDQLVTVFAGVDRSATERARQLMTDIPPSSPCIALFKDGKPVHVLERRHIERMMEADVASDLISAFDNNCSADGPSVDPEVYAKLNHARQCGSSVPPSMPS